MVVCSLCNYLLESLLVYVVCLRDQEMMMQIMDKYVQAGEALAWKENEVLDLTKQVNL